MRQGKSKTTVKNWRYPKIVLFFFLVFMCILIAQFTYLSLSSKIYGDDLKQFAAKRITVEKELIAKRGTIYDSEKNILAINVTSYTLIAYLDSSRTTDASHPKHVVDPEYTAKKLAEVLDADYNYLLDRLMTEGVYQVEFGTVGSKLTELTKIEIENLELPGIDFEESTKRFYPNGAFASYVVGYAKLDDKNIVGELGIESNFNDILSGKNGYLMYQKDPAGYQIPDTPETKVDAIDGKDIYLTIDASIQRFVESTITDTIEQYHPEWMLLTVMDAKTGAILASGTSPSFDPNNLSSDMSYQNPTISYTYEPGSTMKIYTYMCAMEKGVYNGNEEYLSGSFKIGNDTVNDWQKTGWGTINFDTGFQYSSNVAVANIITRHLSADELKSCFNKYGFGNTTGIELSGEATGSIDFNSKVALDTVTAGFGQGISTTAIQHLQALSMIANDGYMLSPHIIKKIVDNSTGKEDVTKVEKSKNQIISSNTVNKLKELMYGTVNNNWATGKSYAIPGFNIIGKTGTAQIYENGHYLTGDSNYILSFSGMFPKDDPEIIIYAAMKKPNTSMTYSLANGVKELIQNIAKYRNMFTEQYNIGEDSIYTLPLYINSNVSDIVNDLNNRGILPIILGSGDTIINQYPKAGTMIIPNDKVFLVTNNSDITIPDMTGWSRIDVMHWANLVEVKLTINNYGFVTNQSIPIGTIVVPNMELVIELKPKYESDKSS